MKRSIDEHATRFDEKAAEYDDGKSEEYEACVELVVEHARDGLDGDDVVLDLGTGTGAIALRLASEAGAVVGRDVSEGMLEQAREKADDRDVENATFGQGTFREPNLDGPVDAESAEPTRAHARVDVVVSNYAMHHLSDDEKREAIAVVDDLDPRRFVLGDVMLFGEADPEEPFYDPSVDDPSTVGVLVDALTDCGFAVTAVEMLHEQVGVIVADRPAAVEPAADGSGR